MIAGSDPASPVTENPTCRSGEMRPSSTIRTSGRTMSMNGTSSPASFRSDDRRQRPCVAGDGEPHVSLRRDEAFLHHPHERADDVDERDVLARLLQIG